MAKLDSFLVVGGPIEHDGRIYTVGDELPQLSADGAAQLLALGEILSARDYKARQKAEAEGDASDAGPQE